MRKAVFVLIVALLLPSAMLFAAGQQQAAAGAPVELDYWYSGSAPQIEFMKNAVDEFNRQSTMSQVRFIERPANQQAMATAIAGGQGPDIMMYNQNTVWFFGLDALYDLKEFVLDRAIGMPADSFLPAPRQSVNYGGQVIALPVSFGLGSVKYNMRLVEEAGLDAKNPPKTWAEFEQWALKLTKRSGNDTTQWGVTTDTVDWLLQEVMFANGGDWNNDTMTEYAPYPNQLTEGLAWVNRLVNELKVMPIPRGLAWGGASQMLASEQGFVNETIAMQIGHSGTAGLVATNPNLRVGLFPVPRGPQAGSTVRISTGYDGLHVMHDAASPRQSYLFAKWFVENKSTDFTWQFFSFPAYARDLTRYRADPRFTAMVDHLLASPVRRFHVFPARLDVRSQEPALLENVLTGRMTPAEAVTTFKAHADRVFRENRSELDEFIRIQKTVW